MRLSLLFLTLCVRVFGADSFFCESYEECRAAFRQEGHRATGQLGSVLLPSAVAPNLTIDYFYLPPTGTPKDLLIVSSGVHGVEGYAGSAIQRHFMWETLPRLDRKHLGILILHLVNPFGTKYRRRVSENNVDLNRNFEKDRKLFNVTNKAYAELDEMLNPAKPASGVWWTVVTFYANTAKQLLHSSVKTLRQAIVGGQYEFPKGIFYGGSDFEPQVGLLASLVKKYGASYSRALILDLHTGYGKEKTLHLIPNPPHSPEVKSAMSSTFAGHPVEDPEGEEFYVNYGNFSTFIANEFLNRGKLAVPMVLEFGTYDNTTTLGGMEALRRMVNENQAHHFGAVNEKAKKNISAEFLEWFYPASPDWRANLLSLAKQWLPRFISQFQKS